MADHSVETAAPYRAAASATAAALSPAKLTKPGKCRYSTRRCEQAANRRHIRGSHETMMCLHKFVRRGFVPMLLLPVLIGCASIGPAVVPRDRTDYRSSMANLMANLINAVTMALATLGRLCRRPSA